jgi:hypothetical protein
MEDTIRLLSATGESLLMMRGRRLISSLMQPPPAWGIG